MKTARSFVAVGVATMVGSACAPRAQSPAIAPPAAQSAERRAAPGDARMGDKTRCPVSGDAFTVAPDSPHATYKGKTYYFCCPGCEKEFQENPGKYVHEI